MSSPEAGEKNGATELLIGELCQNKTGGQDEVGNIQGIPPCAAMGGQIPYDRGQASGREGLPDS